MAAPAKQTRVRLRREDRERLIVDKAITYFADVGLTGDTVSLASKIGVAQPLIYRYFENKEALIARVFEETFLSKWNPLWHDILVDRNRPVLERLLVFHRDFARVQLSRERVRLSLFFALAGWDLTAYFRLMRNQVYVPIAKCLREHAGLADMQTQQLREVELEFAKTVIEKIQYYGIRKWVYELPSMPPIDQLIEISTLGMLNSAADVIPPFQEKGALYSYEDKVR